MITVLRGAKNPVLAHHFLNFLLDNKHGLENFSWLGYMPPLKTINPDKVVAQGYIPKNLGLDDRPRVGLRTTASSSCRSRRRGRRPGRTRGRPSRPAERARVSQAVSLAELRAPGSRLARPPVSRADVRRAGGRVRHGRPDLLEPGAGVEPAALAVRHDARRAAAAAAGPAVLDRVRAHVRVRRRSRWRAASRSATRSRTTWRATRGARRRCCSSC